MSDVDTLQLYHITSYLNQKIEILEEEYKTANGGRRTIITKSIGDIEQLIKEVETKR